MENINNNKTSSSPSSLYQHRSFPLRANDTQLLIDLIEKFVITTAEVQHTINKLTNNNTNSTRASQQQNNNNKATAAGQGGGGLFTSPMFNTNWPTTNNNNKAPLSPQSWPAGARPLATPPASAIFLGADSISDTLSKAAPFSPSSFANFLLNDGKNNNNTQQQQMQQNPFVIDEPKRNRYRTTGMQILDQPHLIASLIANNNNYNNNINNAGGSYADNFYRNLLSYSSGGTGGGGGGNDTDSFAAQAPTASVSLLTTTNNMASSFNSHPRHLAAVARFVVGDSEPTAAFNGTGAAIITIFYTLIVAISLFGNLSVIVVHVFGERWRRSDVAAFFVNLAISDIIQALFCVPFTAHNIIHYWWYFGEIVCRLSAWIQTASVTASTYTLVCIAFDRYYLVKNPLHHRAITGKFRWLLVVMVWLVAFATSLPLYISMELRVSYFHTRTRSTSGEIVEKVVARDMCVEYWKEPWQEMLITFLLVSVNFIVPLCIMSILYHAIIKQMRTKDATLANGFKESNISGNRASSNRITVTAITVWLMFVVCWAPLHIYFLIVSAGSVVAGGGSGVGNVAVPPTGTLGMSMNGTSFINPLHLFNSTATTTTTPLPPTVLPDHSATLLSQIMDAARTASATRAFLNGQQQHNRSNNYEIFRPIYATTTTPSPVQNTELPAQQQLGVLPNATSNYQKTVDNIGLLKIFYLVAHCIAMLNHATNFMTYSYINREFRQDFLSFFRRRSNTHAQSQQQRSLASSFSQSMSMELHPILGWRRQSQTNGYRDSVATNILNVNGRSPKCSTGSLGRAGSARPPIRLKSDENKVRENGLQRSPQPQPPPPQGTFARSSSSHRKISATRSMVNNIPIFVSPVQPKMSTGSSPPLITIDGVGTRNGGGGGASGRIVKRQRDNLCRIKSSPQPLRQQQQLQRISSRDSERPLLLVRASQNNNMDSPASALSSSCSPSSMNNRHMGFIQTPERSTAAAAGNSVAINVFGHSIKRRRQQTASVRRKRQMYQLDKFANNEEDEDCA